MSEQPSETPIAGQMLWKLPGSTETKLYLRLHETDDWQEYTEFPHLMQEEQPELSTGYPTFIALLKQNWKLL